MMERRHETETGKGVVAMRAPRVAGPASVTAVIVGGDLLFREGLKRLFTDGPIELIGEIESLDDIATVDDGTGTPDVTIVIDAAIRTGGEPWGERIRRQWPDTRLVLLANGADEAGLPNAIVNGADGCLFKDMSPRALVQAIGLVALGENVFPTRLMRALVGGGVVTRGQASPRLTPREKDILHGLLAGHSNKMIANNLGTTDMTVKAQLRHLLRKIGAQNRTQAALWAREHGGEHELLGGGGGGAGEPA